MVFNLNFMCKNYVFSVAFALTAAIWPALSNAQTTAQQPFARTVKPSLARSGVANLKKTVGVKQLQNSIVDKVADASLFNGRTLYGSLVNSDDWANMSVTQVPYGIYSFVVNDNPVVTPCLTNMNYNFLSGAYGRGKFYGISALAMMGAITGGRYVNIDTKDWKEVYSKIHSIDDDGRTYSLLASTMAYNPIDNEIYAFQYNDDLTGQYWSRYNPYTNSLEEIAAFRGEYNILTLAADPSGAMFFINDKGDLYSIDKANGRPSLIGFTGVTPNMYSQAMVYDSRTGRFLWAAQTAEGSVLYSVDPETAEAVKIMNFNKNEDFSSLYSLDNKAVDNAPDSVRNFKLSYDADGALTGHVSFSVPNTTFGGSPLGQPVLNVWVDGVNQKGTPVNAGDNVSIPVTFSEGNHYVAVNMSNEQGYSPLSSTYQYAGFDTPDTLSRVTFVSNKTAGKDTVTWHAPESGVNGGYIDKANLKYTVVRMPDSVTVASDYAKTSFVEDIPATMHNYSYRVYSESHGKRSEYVESNNVICGNSFAVPYSENFSDKNTLGDYFTVIDANQDGYTWKNGYSGFDEVRIDLTTDSKDGDDWLISPPIALKSGNKYRFTANLRSFLSSNLEHFKIYVGTDPKDTTTFKLLDDVKDFASYTDFTDHNTDFSIDKDGDYYMAIFYCGDFQQNACMIRLNSIALQKVGAVNAPEGVSDLTVTPGDNDNNVSTIAFTAPTKKLNGEALSSISKIDILRNEDKTPVYTFEAPAVGAHLSWTDQNVAKVGENKYTVIAANDAGAGESVSASAFVGVYTAPYRETFDTRASAGLFTEKYKGVDTKSKYGWSYDNQDMRFETFVGGDSISDAWLFTPAIKLDADGVYKVSYKANIDIYSNSITNKLYAGLKPDPESQSIEIGEVPTNTDYVYQTVSNQLITTTAGKYYLGFNSVARKLYDYYSWNLDSITVEYLRSAKSPYFITNYKSHADATGEVKAVLSFNAPAVNYHGEPLDAISKIEIFRGKNTLPVKTFENPEPGAALSWEDDQPIHGINHYMIVASDSYGRGEAYYDTLYVGRDIADAVTNFRLVGSADNANAVLTWDAPAKSKNGGVLVPSEISYNVYQYNTSDNTLNLVAGNLKDCSFTAPHSADMPQAVYYYAVAPVNTEGVGDTLMHSVVLGKLYEMPFTESFANATLSTSPWLIKTNNPTVVSWGVTNPDGSTYNSATPEDNDGGCAYMYNGSSYYIYTGAGFFTPKMNLGGESKILSFWVYNVKTAYPDAKPTVVVKVSSMDGEPEQLGDTLVVGGDSEDGWKHYTLSLDKYKDSKYIYISFEAFTDGHSDAIYLDNVVVGNEVETGINHLDSDGKAIKSINYFDLEGRQVLVPGNGVFIKTILYEDGTRKNVKVVMK